MDVTNIEISTASLDDLSQIFAIEQQAHIAPWSEAMLKGSLSGKHLCWKLTQGLQLLGYLIVMPVLNQLELLNIVVLSTAQGRGLGEKLMTHLDHYVQQHQVSEVLLEVRESNRAAINLYQKFGFEQVGIRKNYYPGKTARENALLLTKSY